MYLKGVRKLANGALWPSDVEVARLLDGDSGMERRP